VPRSDSTATPRGTANVINPDQMEVVRRIFYMAGVEKTTIYAIKQDLECRGLRTPTGKTD
jgi:hypothetical protein